MMGQGPEGRKQGNSCLGLVLGSGHERWRQKGPKVGREARISERSPIQE